MKIWREKDSPSHPFAEDISILRKAIQSQEAKSDLVRCTGPGDYSPVKHQDLSGGRHDRIKKSLNFRQLKILFSGSPSTVWSQRRIKMLFDRRPPVNPYISSQVSGPVEDINDVESTLSFYEKLYRFTRIYIRISLLL